MYLFAKESEKSATLHKLVANVNEELYIKLHQQREVQHKQLADQIQLIQEHKEHQKELETVIKQQSEQLDSQMQLLQQLESKFKEQQLKLLELGTLLAELNTELQLEKERVNDELQLEKERVNELEVELTAEVQFITTQVIEQKCQYLENTVVTNLLQRKTLWKDCGLSHEMKYSSVARY